RRRRRPPPHRLPASGVDVLERAVRDVRRRPYLLRRTEMGGAAADRVMFGSVWFPRAREVEIRTEAIGAPGVGEVRIRSLASGLSHGTEMLVFRGQVPTNLALDLPTLAGSYGFPIKFGYASVGQVIAVGGGVADLAPGDRVLVHHPHPPEYVASAASAVRLPERLPAELGVFPASSEAAVNG